VRTLSVKVAGGNRKRGSMYKIIRNTLTAGASVITLAMMGGAPAMAAQAAPAAPVHAASVVQPADFADGDPDVFSGLEPDITPRPMCETSFPNNCARDTNNSGSTGSVMFEGGNTPGPAENTKFVRNGGTFSHNGHAYPTGTLVLTGHSGLCYGSPGSDVKTASCSTGAGTIWGHGSSNGHDVWINRLWTQQAGDGGLRVLGAFGTFGDPLEVVPWSNPSFLKRWSF
jgi:hypothetical protein